MFVCFLGSFASQSSGQGYINIIVKDNFKEVKSFKEEVEESLRLHMSRV